MLSFGYGVGMVCRRSSQLKNLALPGDDGTHFNWSTWEAETSGFLSLRPVWSTE